MGQADGLRQASNFLTTNSWQLTTAHSLTGMRFIIDVQEIIQIDVQVLLGR